MADALIYFLISVLVLAVSLLIIAKIPPIGVDIDSPVKALLGGAIIGAFNGIWGFFPDVIRTITWLFTLGIVPLLGSIIVFGFAAWMVEGFRLRWGIWSAIMGSLALAIVSSLLKMILGAFGLVV
ncbi:phage holin family protein [Phormidium sp. FACHB-1136]|jgi:putative membrane protein|uniref:phage holin family protein n=1 Tax=Phormidium sp. FACHB-1136 TaxID=2692848 RepID=UPI001F55133F|nr:phage holin family protein [Phormidium sp. FACHB-1136]